VESYIYFLIKVSRTVKSIQSGYVWPVGRHSYIPALFGWPRKDGTPARGRLGLLCCSETSVRDCHSVLRKITNEADLCVLKIMKSRKIRLAE
jgi:hypothetical protein